MNLELSRSVGSTDVSPFIDPGDQFGMRPVLLPLTLLRLHVFKEKSRVFTDHFTDHFCFCFCFCFCLARSSRIGDFF